MRRSQIHRGWRERETRSVCAPRAVWLAVCALVIATVAACATVPYTGRRQLSIVSDEEEIGEGAQLYGAMRRRTVISPDRDAQAIVREVGSRIAAVAGQPDWSWEFTLFADDDEVNAWALPGGKVGIYTGIFPVARTDAGLATIIGHEVAHAIAHHSGERASQSTLLGVLGGSLVAAGGVIAPGSESMLAHAFGLGANVGVLLPFSRAQESEADEIGLILMAKAGYDPRAAVRVWERMQNVQQKRDMPPEFMSTHPSDASRIARIGAATPRALPYYVDGHAPHPLPRLETLVRPDAAERALLDSMEQIDRLVVRANRTSAVAFAIATEFKTTPEDIVRFANSTKLTPGETALVLATARSSRSSAKAIAASARRGRSWYRVVHDSGASADDVAAELDYIARNARSLR